MSRPPDASQKTLLLVEDDPGVRRATERLLGLDGHTVLSASGAEDALALLRIHGRRIDVLITDVVMPGMSGRDLVRVVHEERPELGVVFLSGYAATHLDHSDLASPRVTFVQKPATRDELARAIASLEVA